MSSRVLNPLVDRAMGVVPKLPIKSETERMFAPRHQGFEESVDEVLDRRARAKLAYCYRARFECFRCGLYEVLLPPSPVSRIHAENTKQCAHCGSKIAGVDGCFGWTDKTIPHTTQPSHVKPGTDYTGNWGKLIKPKRKKIYNCEWCKKDFEVVEYRSKKPKYCSHKCWGERKSYVAEVTKNGR